MPYTKEHIYRIMQDAGRENFLPDSMKPYAGADQALPIAYGQTISQPYVVAFMTHSLMLEKDYSVLEIGTGSGFQTAILAQLVQKVFTIEIIPEMSAEARERLHNLGYRNIRFKAGDGYRGWERHAPYDAIIVTACAEYVPPPLLSQLRNGGKMIIPIGKASGNQNLVLISKSATGETDAESVMPVRFVPFRRK